MGWNPSGIHYKSYFWDTRLTGQYINYYTMICPVLSSSEGILFFQVGWNLNWLIYNRLKRDCIRKVKQILVPFHEVRWKSLYRFTSWNGAWFRRFAATRDHRKPTKSGPGGGIGRHKGLKIPRGLNLPMPVRFRPRAHPFVSLRVLYVPANITKGCAVEWNETVQES